MEDLISRKAAVEAIEETDWYHINKDGVLVRGANSAEDLPLFIAEDVFEALRFVTPAKQQWIPVTERLPESGKHVLVACECRSDGSVIGKYVCDGYYAAAKTITGGCGDDCATEYDEEDDEYYLLEGWYEVIKNWDDYNSIVIPNFVTHWMPLPEPPKEDDHE